MGEKRKPLNIVIVHYHLRRDGVTRVVESSFAVLKERGAKVLILSGESPDPANDELDVEVIPALNYRATGNSDIAESLADALRKTATDYFGEAPDLWHFHNPTLARNVLIPTVIHELATAGERIVMQIHDFPEDGRPTNYASQRSFFDSEASFQATLYPSAKQIHYATLNHRDYRILKSAGVDPSNLHELPDPVAEFSITTSSSERPFSQGRLFGLYPTRGIRRKNLGELLLLALIYGDRVDFATSLSPVNPENMRSHAFWKEAIEELEIPVTLGIADDGEYSYLDILGWSDFLVTTSVAEGFGLAFLEPWMAGKGMMGRNLPEVTSDFQEAGLKFRTLYDRIDLPLSWLDEKQLWAEAESMLRQSYLAYDVRLPRNAVKQTWKAWVRDEHVDFSVLGQERQLEILRRLKDSPELLEDVKVPPFSLASAEEVGEFQTLIGGVYGIQRYGDRLEALYGDVMSSPISKVGSLSTRKLLEQFLDPARLNLLRH